MIEKVRKATDNHAPLVISNSPIPFVISGPRGRHREVLVRSTHDNLDLISYDVSADRQREMVSTVTILNALFSPSAELDRPNSVRSAPTIAISKGSPSEELERHVEVNERLTYLTFAWRGNASRRTIEQVEELFSKSSVDIYEAIREGSAHNLEWHLSEIIRACVYATVSVEYRRKSVVRMGLVVGAGYFFVALSAVLAAFLR